MSIVNSVVESVKKHMDAFATIFQMEARNRAEARDVPPANEQEMGWAIHSEWGTIQTELVMTEVKDKWIDMFKTTIDQANSSYDQLFIESMVAALQAIHPTIQSDFWLRMLKVMEVVASADPNGFDARNAWCRDVLGRMVWAKNHPDEIDALQRMPEDQLRKLRMSI